MNTFICPSQCEALCKSENKKIYHDSKKRKLLLQLVYYPGLTATEKKLVKNHPDITIKVFAQSFMTNRITNQYFGNIGHNDESDAFRHFVWAGRLVKVVGPDFAQQFLDAHEDNPGQPAKEKAMDLANNRAGILEALRLKKQNKLTNQNIERQALRHLHSNKLVILKPKGYIPKEVKKL